MGRSEKEMRLEPGTYEVSTTYKKGTWMSPNELEIMGMVLPIGTYVFYDDGVSDSGLYGYCTDGTITIAEADAGNTRSTTTSKRLPATRSPAPTKVP